MIRLSLLAATLFAAFSVHAERLPIAADAPPAFRAECGACHLAFPPSLLTADDWRRVMDHLDKHYGDDASLDPGTRRSIEAFLVREAGNDHRTEGAVSGGVLPRLTLTPWFRREHHEVSSAVWKDKRVGSAANCGACHTRAEAGSFREREIRMPGGYRHEDD